MFDKEQGSPMAVRKKNYEIEISDLNINVQIDISSPPSQGIEPVMTPGKTSGGIDQKGRYLHSYEPPKWTGKYRGFFSPGQWKYTANIKGHGRAKVLCEHCQHHYSYSYGITERRQLEFLPGSQRVGRMSMPPFPSDGLPHSVQLIGNASWEQMTNARIEKWKKELELEISQESPPYHKCPNCKRSQAFMARDIFRKIISLTFLLLMIPGAIIVMVRPEIIGTDLQKYYGLCFPLKSLVVLALGAAGAMLGGITGILLGVVIAIIHWVYTEIAYRIPFKKEPNESPAINNHSANLNELDRVDFIDRIESHLIMGKFDEALIDLGLKKEKENYAWLYYQRGQIYLETNKWEQAISDFSRAIELDNSYNLSFVHRGKTYWTLGMYEEAISDFSRAIELDDNVPYRLNIVERCTEKWEIMKKPSLISVML